MQIGSITTLIQQLNLLIPPYKRTSQRVLRDFCNSFTPITGNKPIIFQKAFEKKLKQFDTQYRYTNEYYKFPFLWFACDFFNIVYTQIVLAKNPLDFVRMILRKGHSFIKLQVSLTDIPKWEGLQYTCHRTIAPLLNEHFGDELQIIFGINSLIKEEGLGIKKKALAGLNPKHIFDEVRSAIHGPPWKPPVEDQVKIFCELSRIEWSLLFYPKAFQLARLFVVLRINQPKKFQEIQGAFIKSEAQISQTSRIFRTRGSSEEFFVGWIIIPKNEISLLSFHNFLDLGEDRKIFKTIECQEVADFKYSVSYNFYQPGLGWTFETKDFKAKMRKKHPLKYFKTLDDKKILSTDDDWNPDNFTYQTHKKATQVIKTFCKYWRGYSYNDLCDLAGDVKRNQDNTKLFAPDNVLLRELLKKKVIQIMIIPWGLIESYSLDYYMIFPPRTISKEKLKIFISILPYSLSFELYNGKIRIFCYLNQRLARVVRNNLKWELLAIRYIAMPKPSVRHYDFEINSWKKPWFLTETKLGKLQFSKNT